MSFAQEEVYKPATQQPLSVHLLKTWLLLACLFACLFACLLLLVTEATGAAVVVAAAAAAAACCLLFLACFSIVPQLRRPRHVLHIFKLYSFFWEIALNLIMF